MNDIRMSKKQNCCICGNEFEGFGNNPVPARDGGRCCDKCNMEVVIPLRFFVSSGALNEYFSR